MANTRGGMGTNRRPSALTWLDWFPPLAPPVLLSLALHGWRFWILHFHLGLSRLTVGRAQLFGLMDYC
jgi:hypothetical protein